MNEENEYLALCKRLIEEKCCFGKNGNGLRQRDLEYLSSCIEEKSGVKLSLSTLKRLWKKDYDQTPHPSTLAALVSVLGYKDWQEFRSAQSIPEATRASSKVIGDYRSYIQWMLPAGAILVVAVWFIAFASSEGPPGPVIKGAVVFEGNKTVARGVPNTIIFNYDVTNVQADSFFFQQSWNELEKTRIDPEKHYYSAIYYYPGFHRAKLVANDSIIKRFNAHITTDGWMPLVRHAYSDRVPAYIKAARPVLNGALHVTSGDLVSAGAAVDKEFMVSYFNVREFDDTSSDNFSLATRIVCDSIPSEACPTVDVVVMCEEHIFFVMLTGKGCERNIAVKMGELVQTGSNSDLSAFGRDLYRWQDLRVEVVNKKATIYLDNRQVHVMVFKKDFGKVVGLAYHFSNTGAVDYVKLSNGGGRIVYEDAFGG